MRKEKPSMPIHLCPTCHNPLERCIGNVKFRYTSNTDDRYPGSLLATYYYLCGVCSKG